AMLQAKDCGLQTQWARSGRAVLVALLAAVAVGVSALRSPAQKIEGGAEKAALPKDVHVDVKETTTGSFLFRLGVNADAGLTGSIALNERIFDVRPALPYLSASHAGVWTFHPAAVFGRPEMQKFLDHINASEEFQAMMKECGLEPNLGKLLGPVEQ